MKKDKTLSDDRLLTQLGARVTVLRLSKNLTQAGLAQQAGVGLRTLQRLESGSAATQLSGLVRVCRALDFLDRFESLVPAVQASPLAQLKAQSTPQRKRASTRKSVDPATPKKWTWGEP